jgi:hypothetical protein
MRLRFTPNDANKDNDFYWVQSIKDTTYVKEDGNWEQLTPAAKDKWRLDGDVLNDATRPFSYGGQKLGKATTHDLYDFPGQTISVKVMDQSFDSNTKKLTITLDKSPKDKLPEYQKMFVDEYKEVNYFRTFLVPVGGDPVGRVNWGYFYFTKGNEIIKLSPDWVVTNKDDAAYKEATGQ